MKSRLARKLGIGLPGGERITREQPGFVAGELKHVFGEVGNFGRAERFRKYGNIINQTVKLTVAAVQCLAGGALADPQRSLGSCAAFAATVIADPSCAPFRYTRYVRVLDVTSR